MTSPHSPSPHAMSTPREQEQREPRFWSCRDDDEQLACEDISEAVYLWADDIAPDALPETVEVIGFASMPLPTEERIAETVLDHILEWLDEDYADPSGGGWSKPTAAMREAATAFARVLRAEYTPWACEEVTRITVRVADHVPADWPAPSAPRETPT